MAFTEKLLYANNAKSTLAAPIAAGDLALAVQAGAGALFPSPGAGEAFLCTIRDAAGNYEIIKVTTRSVDSFTAIVRAQDGTTARGFAAGDKVEIRPTRAHMKQLVTQDARNITATAGGSPDALTATFDPPFASLINGMEVHIRAASANATTTPTLAVDGLTAKTIVKYEGIALVIGDIIGSGHELILKYNSTLDKFVLKNPPSTRLQVDGVGGKVFSYFNFH